MGLTPLEGLVMGTRSGDIDPAIIFHLHDSLGMSVDQINKMLTKESGLLGLTEVTSDCRYVEDNYDSKADAKRAMDVFCHRGQIRRRLQRPDGRPSGRGDLHRRHRRERRHGA